MSGEIILNEEKIYRPKTAEQQQQEFFLFFGHADNIIFDSYKLDQKDALKNKIRLIISTDDQLNRTNGKKENALIAKIVEAIWKQMKYNGGKELLMSIIFVLTTDYENYRNELNLSKFSTKFSVHPVFRIRKCVESNGDSSHNRCMIFVDENARVYNNWNDYVKTNALPKSIVIAPKRGIYNGDYSNRVILDIFCSPKCGIGNTVIRSVDIGSTIAAIGSSGIMIASIMTTATIAAPVLVGAAAVGIGSAAYSTIRSTFNLVDRHQHEQTLSFGDVDARGNWLGVAGGAAGMASSAISPSISFLARNGRTIGVPLQATCNVINASAIAANGAGIVNGFFGIFLRIRDDDPISPLDAAQLAASLFLFTHSLNNFQSAKRIIKNSQDQEVTTIRRRLSFKESLTNNLRRYLRFDKMAKENVRLYGSEGDQHDIVRPLRNIPERIKIVSNAIKLKSALDDDAENIRFTLSMNGKAVLKNLTCSYIDKEEGILTLFDIDLGQFIRSIYNAFFVFNYDDLKTIIIDIIEFYTVQSVNLILDVDKIFSEKEGKSLIQSKLNTLLDFTKRFVEGEGESIQKKLNRIIPFETFLDDIFKVFQEMCTKSLADIPRETLIQKIHDFYENLRPQRQPDALCGECNGMYFIA